MTRPRVSVIVPTFERTELLRSCILSFDSQEDPPGFDVVVVDDGSGDDTPAVLAELAADRPWLQWASQPANRGPAAARNRAVSLAQGELLLFVDDDIVASPSLLRHHDQLHKQAGDDQLAILGRVDWHPSLEITPFMRWLDRSGLQFAYDTWLREGPVEAPASAFYTANLSMSRQLILDAGGFDERFPYPAYEDLELAQRLTTQGLRMHYRPAALAYHRRAIDLPTFIQRMVRVGESAVLMRAISPEFAIDDHELVSRRGTRGRLRRIRAKAAIRRNQASRSAYYWAVIASAYDLGRRRAQQTARAH
jgi:glycosyltransferase involved in cell wall biosynthesis